MEITIRNITKDTMVDFNNDHTITLPMDEEKLRNMLGNDEWIIVDAPVGDEFTNIEKLNALLNETDEDNLRILTKAFLLNEIMESGFDNFSIVDFDAETSQYNGGNGVIVDEEWYGRVLHDLGYINFPFAYTEDMEDYVKWEQLWYTANSEGWCNVRYNGNICPMRRIVTVKAIYDISDPVFREPGMLTDKKQVEEVIFNEVSNIFLDNEDIMDLQVTCEDI